MSCWRATSRSMHKAASDKSTPACDSHKPNLKDEPDSCQWLECKFTRMEVHLQRKADSCRRIAFHAWSSGNVAMIQLFPGQQHAQMLQCTRVPKGAGEGHALFFLTIRQSVP